MSDEIGNTDSISEEMVDKAWDAAMGEADCPELSCSTSMIRAALSAVAPMLIAQGMREACKELIWEDEIPVINEQIRKAILARAAEIEGGKE